MEDKELKKLVKKSRNRQTKKILGTYAIMLLCFALIGLVFMSVYNYGPFKADKVSGLRDDRIKTVEQQSDVGALLFDQVQEIQMNTDVNQLTIHIDYYEGEKLISATEPFQVGDAEETGEELSGLKGSLMYGIPTGEKRMIIDFIGDGYRARGQLDFDEYLTLEKDKGWSSQEYYYEGTERIERDKKYYLYLTQTGGNMYLDFEQNLSKKKLKETKQTIVMYMVLK
ncbi:hypothetical protein [Enterococcus olivae]